jgi:hypothetical protein
VAKYRFSDVAGYVIDTETGANIPLASDGWQVEAYTTWLTEGNTPDAAPAMTDVERNLAIRAGLSAWLDSVVQGNGYDNVVSCASYVGSSNAKRAAEARAAIDWRDAVYDKAADLEENPPDGVETLAQVLALMPQPADFGWVADTPGWSSASGSVESADMP